MTCIEKHLRPGGTLFMQSDVLDVVEDMRIITRESARESSFLVHALPILYAWKLWWLLPLFASGFFVAAEVRTVYVIICDTIAHDAKHARRARSSHAKYKI